jgi:hypothetical protein
VENRDAGRAAATRRPVLPVVLDTKIVMPPLAVPLVEERDRIRDRPQAVW